MLQASHGHSTLVLSIPHSTRSRWYQFLALCVLCTSKQFLNSSTQRRLSCLNNYTSAKELFSACCDEVEVVGKVIPKLVQECIGLKLSYTLEVSKHQA